MRDFRTQRGAPLDQAAGLRQLFAAPRQRFVPLVHNPHVAFGGGGVHFCLGNHVARLQMRALFGELLTRAPDLKVGEPELVTGYFMHAIKRMPCSL